MAAAPVKQKTGASRAQLPPCYYEGYLEKRGPKEKVSRRLWTCLCGNTLYFFNNAKDTHYVEKLDLSGFVSLIDDCSRDRNLEAARMNLRMKDGEIKLTAPNLEARELWKGFLYSVVDPFRGGLAGVFWIIVLLQNPSSLQLEVTNLPIYQSGKGYKAISKALGLPRTAVRAITYKWRKHGTVENLPRRGRPTKITSRVQRQLIQEVTKDPTTTSKELQASLASVKLAVPTILTLLPGQLHMLKEVVEKERQRRRARSLSRAPSSPLSLPLVGEIPACFRPVSRTEAEVLLERHPDCGNMLLRPGRDGTSLAVTTRQDLNGSVFRHYRVTQKPQGGYIIDVENPIPCPTLHDVINALVEKTAGTLQPFLLEEPYEENITYISSNDENGERMLHCAPTGTFPRRPSLPPKGPERWTLRSHSKSPSPSQRSLSPPGSPSSPMRRLVLSPSPSPLTQTAFTEELKQKLEKRRTSQD
ncbi:hypothetical protein QTP86_016600 [Hemibagrus guttatus]|nr:hypothetical protein QTP86_016600 [Hemibagrus guttatus]